MHLEKTALAVIAGCLLVVSGCKSNSDQTPTTATTSPSTPAASSSGSAPPVTPPATSEGAGGSLVGDWSQDAGQGRTLTWTFNEDGNLVISGSAPVPNSKSPLSVLTTASYKLDGAKFSMHVTSLKETSDDPKVQQAVDMVSKSIDEKLKAAPATEGTATWKDKDHVTLATKTPAFSGVPAEEKTIELARKQS